MKAYKITLLALLSISHLALGQENVLKSSKKFNIDFTIDFPSSPIEEVATMDLKDVGKVEVTTLSAGSAIFFYHDLPKSILQSDQSLEAFTQGKIDYFFYDLGIDKNNSNFDVSIEPFDFGKNAFTREFAVKFKGEMSLKGRSIIIDNTSYFLMIAKDSPDSNLDSFLESFRMLK